MPARSSKPIYVDGKAFVCGMVEVEDDWGNKTEELQASDKCFWFEERGITDNLRFTSGAVNVKVEKKLRTRQDKSLEPEIILKIGEKYYTVLNSFHFYDKDNYPQTDLTLGKYNG